MPGQFRPARFSYAMFKLFTVADLSAKAVADVIDFGAVNLTNASNAFLNVAKAFIALDGRATADEIKAGFIKAGVTAEKYKSARKNAQQAIDVWDYVVKMGHADEAWFDTLTYHEFVAVNRACKKLGDMPAIGARVLAERGLFKKRIGLAIGEIEAVYETPKAAPAKAPEVKASEILAVPEPTPAPALTPAPAVAQDAAPAAPATPATSSASTATPSTEAPPVAPAPSPVSAPSPTSSTTATSAASPIEEVTVTAPAPTATEAKKALPMSAETAAMKALKAAEDAVLGLILVAQDEVAVGRVMERVVALKVTLEAARDKRFPAVDVASLKSLEQHVVAA